jgi:hypothetical protein
MLPDYQRLLYIRQTHASYSVAQHWQSESERNSTTLKQACCLVAARYPPLRTRYELVNPVTISFFLGNIWRPWSIATTRRQGAHISAASSYSSSTGTRSTSERRKHYFTHSVICSMSSNGTVSAHLKSTNSMFTRIDSNSSDPFCLET